VEQGENLFRLGRIEEAILTWKRALAANAEDDHLQNRIGDAYARLGLIEEASVSWERAAERLMLGGFHLKAVPILRKVLKLDPTRLDVQERIGDGYARAQRVIEADEELRLVGESYIQNGQIRRAIEVFQKIAANDPDDLNGQITLAHLLVEAGRPEEASRCHFLLARGMAASGHEKEAIGLLRKGVELDPRNEDALRLLADLLVRAGERGGAIETLERLLMIDADRIDVLSDLRNLCLATGRDEDAARLLERLSEIDPQSVRIRSEQARRKIEAGEIGEGYAILRPLADATARRGDPIRAVALLAPVIAADGNHVEALRASLAYYRQAWACRFETGQGTETGTSNRATSFDDSASMRLRGPGEGKRRRPTGEIEIEIVVEERDEIPD
jgi:tetratricopeptide (TPR) repeat protein